MNRRLRKKLYRGEFVLYGADVTFEMPGINTSGNGSETEEEIAARLAFFDREMDALLAFTDARLLGAGGGYNEDGSAQFFVTKVVRRAGSARWRKSLRRVSVTEDDCIQMAAYLASRNAVDIVVTRTDAWA